MPFLTIFTPTYNREKLLPCLYNSLCKQTDKDFCWLIIDDGSQDNTKNLVKQWVLDNQIAIQYVYQNNGGKHVAHNHAVELCETDLFFCVDSDDTLSDNAVSIIHSYWEKDKKSADKFMGYCTKRGGESNYINANSPYWPKENTLVMTFELGAKYHYKGETALIWITKELKKYSFPVFPGERFVTEIVLYFQFKKPMKVKNDIFYYFTYQPDGYTKSGFTLQIKNPIGTAIEKKVLNLFTDNFLTKLKGVIKYYGWIYCFHLKLDQIEKAFNAMHFENRRISPALNLLGVFFGVPCGFLYRRKINISNEKQGK